MTEYVTPNIHTVLKKYQTSAPKSLQGPGHALAAAGCTTGSNCPLDATLAGVGGSGGSGGSNADLNIGSARNLCGGHLSVGIVPPNGLASGNNKLSPHCPPIASSSSTCSSSPNSGALPVGVAALSPVASLIKKEVLSSPEPHELGETLPPQTMPLPLSMSSQPIQSQSQTAPLQPQPPLTTVKIVPPPPPELSQPIFTAPDSGSGVLYETRLEGKTIGCFSLGGEMRLCLPQFLNNVLAEFTLDQINRIFDELGIYCSQCTPDQLLEFKTAKILPSDVKASGLITRTDAERLCAALLHRIDRNSYISDDDIPKGAISFKVYHRCFGKCEGICTPDLYSYTKPTCIMCLECKGWFSPQKFVGHVHRKVENRTCHWGFDSRNWHDYLHVALDVESREKYQKILDELKEVEIKEALKAQHELFYMKRKAEMHMDDTMFRTALTHSLPGMAPPAHHQALALSEKQRPEMLDIPTKKSKGLEEASVYQLEYQRYQSLMYAHCAQQQRVGTMSAFRPWAPKSFLHAAATYNAVAAFSTLPYLSQEPPVLQNPERVVRSTDRERFERTYQPNVALVPRKCIIAKEREKEQREHRERERERERERIEREREVERKRERENESERERERERSREREHNRERVLERERIECEMQQHQEQHMLQQQKLHHQHQQSPQETLQRQLELPNLCATQLQIKQERANTPIEMPQSPPLTNVSCGEEEPSDHRSNGALDEDATLPMISPISLTINQQQHKVASNCNNSNSSGSGSSNSCHSDVENMQQQQAQQQEQQSRRHSLYTSNSSACSTSSATSTTPPQQQLLPAHLPPPHHQQQQQRHLQHLPLQQQQSHLRQSPRTYLPSPTDTRSSEEFSGSNEISSSTSPAPCNENKYISLEHVQRHTHSQQTGRQGQGQAIIATVNQHAKLLPTPISATFTANVSNNSNSNNSEVPSRIRISKNLINRSNIIRSPTPPPPLPPQSALAHLHPHRPNQEQILQNHQQQYEFYKQTRYYDNPHQPQQQQQQQQSLPSIQHQNLIMHSHHHSQQTPHSPSPSQSSNATGLNLSTHPTKVIVRPQPIDVQKDLQCQPPRPHNGLPYIGSEFELSTDTDDDSVNGEPDSSNMLAPWDIAVEALRDTRPRERDRVLGLLRKLLHENQQFRYNNLQLNEMVHKRDMMIRELREQLQSCRRHMELRSVQQEMPAQTNGLHKNDGCREEGARGLPLKKSLLSSTERSDLESYVETMVATIAENDTNPAEVASTGMATMRPKKEQSTNGQPSDTEDEDEDSCNRKISEDDDVNGSDVESDNGHGAADEVPNVVDMQENVTTNMSKGGDLAERNLATSTQAKRSKIDSDDDNICSGNNVRKANTRKKQRSMSHRTVNESNFSDSEDEMPPIQTVRNPMSDNGDKSADYKNNGYAQMDYNEDEENEENEEVEASRFTATNGSGTDTSDDDGDENSRTPANSRESEEGVQAPHSSALATPPTATTPLSPDSGATAGQLFDSSNSSDETSMKKAQMSASDALAKMSEAGDDVDELTKHNEKPQRRGTEGNCAADQAAVNAHSNTNDDAEKVRKTKPNNVKDQHISRGCRHVAETGTQLGKGRECKGRDYNSGNMTTTSRSAVEQITRTPLATKASKKQTPTTNSELRIKKEII